MTDHCDGETRAALEARGWDVVDAEHADLGRLSMLAQVDFVVAGLRPDHYEDDLRRLAVLRAVSPDLPLVAVAEAIEQDGVLAADVLIDVPIIRAGANPDLLQVALFAIDRPLRRPLDMA
ncbi:hypothetical protein [Caulobacter flavus]|uniref:hypothetical protein n=1 Tax=Caulobacter flavus TaxID=1679497 RepID=UPI0011AEFB19|nr:hypothetical protein [Caulobacter flavus]